MRRQNYVHIGAQCLKVTTKAGGSDKIQLKDLQTLNKHLQKYNRSKVKKKINRNNQNKLTKLEKLNQDLEKKKHG